jgi:hypothetical protein
VVFGIDTESVSEEEEETWRMKKKREYLPEHTFGPSSGIYKSLLRCIMSVFPWEFGIKVKVLFVSVCKS